MKKLLSVILLAALLTTGCAAAETLIDGISDRQIALSPAGLNPTVAGESPTTGRDLSRVRPGNADFAGLAVTGRYLPMLVQIDNTDNGANKRAPWGAVYADVVYESPLRRDGETRISLLFSDLIPDDVGPCRSARLGHAWLREEWGAAFMYYGQQEYPLTSVKEEFDRLGTNTSLLYSGTVGDNASHPWKKYYYARKGLKDPHNAGGNAAAMLTLADPDYTAPNHTWLFTDEVAEGDPATRIMVDWAKKNYYSEFRYSETMNAYTRSVFPNGKKKASVVYSDYDTGAAITFANVIIQWTDVDWVTVDAPVTRSVGDAEFFKKYSTGNFTAQGNADYFMNGVHIAGCWRREGMSSRTVFYGPDGQEIALQRGRTMIIMFPATERQIHGAALYKKPTVMDFGRSVSYE